MPASLSIYIYTSPPNRHPSSSIPTMASFPPNHPHLQLKLQQQQQLQQTDPFRNISPQISPPIEFFADDSYRNLPDPSLLHAIGLDLGAEWEPQRKRLKEQDFLENSQVTSAGFLQAGSVSTGLGLSLDDGRVAGSSSGDSPLPLLPTVDAGLGREMQRMEAEMDRFVRIQSERLRQSILENYQAKQLQTLASLQEKVQRMLQEKEAEVDDINKKNMELEELIRQLNIEVGTWQQRAKHTENMIAALKLNLQQVYAQGRGNKEGCGDSEVEDTASCCNGGAIDFQLLFKESQNMKESMTCKVCGSNEVTMLLLPCRHLCLCKDCESKLSFCPLCQSSKFIGMEIYM